LRIVTGLPVLFTSAVTREKLFFASASPIVSVDVLPLSALAIITARIRPQIKWRNCLQLKPHHPTTHQYHPRMDPI